MSIHIRCAHASLSRDWHDSLRTSMDTIVIALDITGAFDRVWYAGLLEKLHAKGIQGHLLMLMNYYLQGRTYMSWSMDNYQETS